MVARSRKITGPGAARRPPSLTRKPRRKGQQQPMEFRQFGRTGLSVSAIGFGCWEIAGGYGQIDAALFDRAVQRAIDGGINCFDTAEAYGMGVSERALARALGSRRQEVCVVTKVGIGYPEAPNRRDSSPK